MVEWKAFGRMARHCWRSVSEQRPRSRPHVRPSRLSTSTSLKISNGRSSLNVYSHLSSKRESLPNATKNNLLYEYGVHVLCVVHEQQNCLIKANLSLETAQSMRASLAVESTMNGRRMCASSMDAEEVAEAEGEADGLCARPDCEATSSGFASAGSSGTRWRLRAIRRLRPMCYNTQVQTGKWLESGNQETRVSVNAICTNTVDACKRRSCSCLVFTRMRSSRFAFSSFAQMNESIKNKNVQIL